jgi:hypothetical protein
MLQKSNCSFNFTNISASLLPLYTSVKHQTQDLTRLLIIKKSKSALLCPLFSGQDSELIGSLELYRGHSQIFDTECEKRVQKYAQMLQDFCGLFIRMRRT